MAGAPKSPADAAEDRRRASLRGLRLKRIGDGELKPELEIFADDVNARMDATVGEPDAQRCSKCNRAGLRPNRARALADARFRGGCAGRIGERRARAFGGGCRPVAGGAL